MESYFVPFFKTIQQIQIHSVHLWDGYGKRKPAERKDD